MAIDVYVMPLWRYHSGQFESPMERFAANTGILVKIIRLQPKHLLNRYRAKQHVRNFQNAFATASGLSSSWVDSGDVLYNDQFRRAAELKAFAQWIDIEDLIPEWPGGTLDDVWTQHRERMMRTKWSYPLLVEFDCWSGHLLPMDFPGIVEVQETVQGRSFVRKVASAPALLQELERLNEHLGVPEDWVYSDHYGHRLAPMNCFHQLRKILRLSVKHSLPVMFDG
jgi:hypothetical protein